MTNSSAKCRTTPRQNESRGIEGLNLSPGSVERSRPVREGEHPHGGHVSGAAVGPRHSSLTRWAREACSVLWSGGVSVSRGLSATRADSGNHSSLPTKLSKFLYG